MALGWPTAAHASQHGPRVLPLELGSASPVDARRRRTAAGFHGLETRFRACWTEVLWTPGRGRVHLDSGTHSL
jgi:hypothetical protein